MTVLPVTETLRADDATHREFIIADICYPGPAEAPPHTIAAAIVKLTRTPDSIVP
jgi:hypothetical protein